LNKSKRKRVEKERNKSKVNQALYERIGKDIITKNLIPILDLVIEKLKSGESIEKIIEEIEESKKGIIDILKENNEEVRELDSEDW
jgi:hypothetical protein